jgi:chromosome segregation ATPase
VTEGQHQDERDATPSEQAQPSEVPISRWRHLLRRKRARATEASDEKMVPLSELGERIEVLKKDRDRIDREAETLRPKLERIQDELRYAEITAKILHSLTPMRAENSELLRLAACRHYKILD